MINIDQIRMNFVYGDLLVHALDGRFDVIVHGCNCFHTMGKGIAKQIKHQFSEAYGADLRTGYGDPYKLGSVSIADINRIRMSPSRKLIHFRVVNAYTQFFPGRNADLDCIRACFHQIYTVFGSIVRIGIPMIGCGIGGLEWIDVDNAIYNASFAYNEHHGEFPDITLVVQREEKPDVEHEIIPSSINDS
ncbi:hypothetical protein LCGC14_1397840 [marine sediment metagenome]|uniref:Macro domain-containing protein n=1 Tax=marine sediment metagenome TaxID=412755 RepID=A0A0F9JY15_9ZZZZ